MGAWGTGILENDLAKDVYADFFELYDDGTKPNEICRRLRQQYSEELDDPVWRSEFWLAVTQAMWECGALKQRDLARALKILNGRAALSEWEEASRQRKASLARFASKIVLPRTKPRLPKERRPVGQIFEPGTCLAVRLLGRQKRFGAVIVLDVSSHKHDTDHLVGGLQGVFTELPELKIFKRRRFLRLSHHGFSGERLFIVCGASSY